MKIIALIYLSLLSLGITAQIQDFKIVYNLNEDGGPVVEGATGIVSADTAAFGGTHVDTAYFTTDGSYNAWLATINKNGFANFITSYIQFPFSVKDGYEMKVTLIKFRHRLEGNRTLAFNRYGLSANGDTPEFPFTKEFEDSMPFSNSFATFNYVPGSSVSSLYSGDQPTFFMTARGHPNIVFDWLIDNVEIIGYVVPAGLNSTVTITDIKKQKMRYGIDAERLWFWRTNSLSTRLAELGVKNMKTDFVRVAVNCAYEKVEGQKDFTTYSKILNMMNAMKTANPNIAFFASPRPLAEAYSKEEAISEWGHKDNIPWSPYPRWILQWNQNGTKTMDDGTLVPQWTQGFLNVPKLVQYYADYLNLMHEEGFKITYLDVTNEKNVITPAINKYIYDNLPAKLNAGVHMPSLIAPSTWSRKQGIEWLKSVNRLNNEHLAFDIASTHNTDLAGTAAAFSAEARKLGKEVWNTELHGWVGINPNDEILNSAHLWEHIRGGFSGIDTWLFYGPYEGKDHTMIWSDNSSIRTSYKYEIFKDLVNSSNYGDYLVSNPPPGTSIPTTAFIKDSVLTVWVLNNTNYPLPGFKLAFQNWDISNRIVKVKRWHRNISKFGASSVHYAHKSSEFDFGVNENSLYFFEIDLKIDATPIEAGSLEGISLYPNPSAGIFYIAGLKPNAKHVYSVYSSSGKEVKAGILGADGKIDLSMQTPGFYIIEMRNNGILKRFKVAVNQ